MSFTVEDGTGKSDATSYASVAVADAYHVDHGDPQAWKTAADTEKEEALQEATQFLDLKFGERWKGRRTTDDQALDWPRSYMETRDGFGVSSDEMVTRLLNATAYLALKALSATLFPDEDSAPLKASKVKVGPIVVEEQYQGGKPTTTLYRIVGKMLAEYINPIGHMERG